MKKVRAKGVEVVGNTGTSGFVFLDRIDALPKHNPTAILEFDQKQGNGIKRIVRRVGEEFDLYDNSNQLQQYKGYKVAEISGITNTVRFTNGVSVDVTKRSATSAKSMSDVFRYEKPSSRI